MVRILVLAILISGSSSTLFGQTELENNTRSWYSLFVQKKISPRWSVQQYSLLATRSLNQRFWLSQFEWGANYRLDRYWTIKTGYGVSLYKYNSWWEKHYEHEPFIGQLIGFQNISIGIRHRQYLTRKLMMETTIGSNYYIPALEKYQLRTKMSVKLSSSSFPNFLNSKFYLQNTIYHFTGGKIIDPELNHVTPPNGIHRHRLKVNWSFRALGQKNIRFNLYYMINTEFNLDQFQEIWLEEIDTFEVERIAGLPVNNYKVIGFQISLTL